MGSQSVTDFSAVRKARIRAAIRSGDAWSAGSEAINAFTKTGHYAQCLTSPSVREAENLLVSLAKNLKQIRKKKQLDETLEKYGVQPDEAHPYAKLAAELQRNLGERLSQNSKATDSAFAARDAVVTTLIDVLSSSVEKNEPADASKDEVLRAFQKVPIGKLASTFHKNVITSLVQASLTAARGTIPRSEVNRIVEEIRSKLADRLGKEIVKVRRKQKTHKKRGESVSEPGWLPSQPEKLPLKELEKVLKSRGA